MSESSWNPFAGSATHASHTTTPQAESMVAVPQYAPPDAGPYAAEAAGESWSPFNGRTPSPAEAASEYMANEPLYSAPCAGHPSHGSAGYYGPPPVMGRSVQPVPSVTDRMPNPPMVEQQKMEFERQIQVRFTQGVAAIRQDNENRKQFMRQEAHRQRAAAEIMIDGRAHAEQCAIDQEMNARVAFLNKEKYAELAVLESTALDRMKEYRQQQAKETCEAQAVMIARSYEEANARLEADAARQGFALSPGGPMLQTSASVPVFASPLPAPLASPVQSPGPCMAPAAMEAARAQPRPGGSLRLPSGHLVGPPMLPSVAPNVVTMEGWPMGMSSPGGPTRMPSGPPVGPPMVAPSVVTMEGWPRGLSSQGGSMRMPSGPPVGLPMVPSVAPSVVTMEGWPQGLSSPGGSMRMPTGPPMAPVMMPPMVPAMGPPMSPPIAYAGPPAGPPMLVAAAGPGMRTGPPPAGIGAVYGAIGGVVGGSVARPLDAARVHMAAPVMA